MVFARRYSVAKIALVAWLGFPACDFYMPAVDWALKTNYLSILFATATVSRFFRQVSFLPVESQKIFSVFGTCDRSNPKPTNVDFFFGFLQPSGLLAYLDSPEEVPVNETDRLHVRDNVKLAQVSGGGGNIDLPQIRNEIFLIHV